MDPRPKDYNKVPWQRPPTYMVINVLPGNFPFPPPFNRQSYSIGASAKVIIAEVNNVITKVTFNGISTCFLTFARKNKGIKSIITTKAEPKTGTCILPEVPNMILTMSPCLLLGNK